MSDALLAGLVRQGFESGRAEAIAHALMDIAESMNKIYEELVPRLVQSVDEPAEVFKDKLWDVREEFRHVEYHLKDAELVDL
ncbi:MAG: hypothetical protein RL701_7770 [Pseudomonadota bacterium]|jgi:hypothetical protein